MKFNGNQPPHSFTLAFMLQRHHWGVATETRWPCKALDIYCLAFYWPWHRECIIPGTVISGLNLLSCWIFTMNPMKKQLVLFLSPLYRWETEVTETCSGLLRIAQLLRSSARIWTRGLVPTFGLSSDSCSFCHLPTLDVVSHWKM